MAQNIDKKVKVTKPSDYPNKEELKKLKELPPLKEYVFPKVKGRPKVLMITDVEGWGAWKRGEYIKKLLSDEFEFDLMDLHTFEEHIKKKPQYDVFYVLLHILMRYPMVQEFAENIKTISVVTSRQILKESYGYDKKSRLELFKRHMDTVNILEINNLLVRRDASNWFHGKVRYAPRGVDPEIFKYTNYSMDGKFIVYHVGKPVFQKGLDKYIKPTCKRAGAKLIVNKRNYTNALPESHMVKMYNFSHAYMVASTIDGTPNPALEAAACGRPIISNRIGNMPEFIEDGINGFLVPLDHSEYFRRLTFLMKNRERAYTMGQKARETVLKAWTWDHVLNKYQRHILREILN